MILFLLPAGDCDPAEAAVPRAALREAGFEVRCATPGGHAPGMRTLLEDATAQQLSARVFTR
ncbi:hypothetical protein ACTVZO_01615 [Streptomyces sp. IBSNAI002]|uniref:hypothetical protein n=1 Tax=Streptomyces sp. IBSNAI002 TaxID=3457500 RepID=UPI003FD1626C